MAIELVKDGLSLGQINNLVDIINGSGIFTVDERGYVSPVEIKPGYPSLGRIGPAPLGLVEGSRAQLLNLEKKFPEDYHSKLRQLFSQV